mgnify:CR=1 FL=1
MKIEIPRKNWTSELSDAIRNSSDGDVIVCHGPAMMELGKLAAARMCPEKNISFEVEGEII